MLLVLLLAGAALAAFRYLPALDDARALRADLETMADRVQEAGLGIDRPAVNALDQDLAAATGRLGRVRDLLAGDPLVALARALPPTAADIRGADDAVAAAGDLLSAAGDGLAIGRRYVEIKEGPAAAPAPPTPPPRRRAPRPPRRRPPPRRRARQAARSLSRTPSALRRSPSWWS